MVTVNTRLATIEDAYLVLDLAIIYAKETSLHNPLKFDQQHTLDHIEDALIHYDQFIILSTVNGNPVGGYWGACGPMVHTPDKVGYDLFMYVKPDYRGFGLASDMIKLALKQYDLMGAKAIYAGLNSGIRGHGQDAYMHNGFQLMGQTFIKI